MSVSEITDTRQYLTFKLGGEVFATDVSKVREVLDFTTITKIPRTPEFMSGVINLRGNVVPVVDLRIDGHWGLSGFGRGRGRPGAGSDRAGAENRHADPHGVY